MRSLALLAFAALLLAGCSGTAVTETTSAPPSSSSTPPPATASTSPAATTTSPSAPPPPANHPPAISAFAAERAAPTRLAFNFTFAASDQDPGSLAWTLDADGDGAADADGASLPGRVPFTYASAGLYSAKLTVSDGEASDERTLDVNATLAPSGPLKTFSAEWKVGFVWCVNYPFNPVLAEAGKPTPFNHSTPAANVLYGSVALTSDLAGHAYTVDFGAPFKNDTKAVDTGIVAFYDAADAYLDSASSVGGLGADPTVAPPASMVVSGIIPAGAATATLFNCANPNGLKVAFIVS